MKRNDTRISNPKASQHLFLTRHSVVELGPVQPFVQHGIAETLEIPGIILLLPSCTMPGCLEHYLLHKIGR